MKTTRRYVQGVHEVIDAAKEWDALFSAGIKHAPVVVAGCPHCIAERRLREAVARLESVMSSG
jgi:hypothetical protein